MKIAPSLLPLISASLFAWVARAAEPLPIATAFPLPAAQRICPDTPLRLTFDGPVALGPAGMIHIVDAATGRDADTIDIGAPVATKTIGTEPNYRYYPVIITGSQATIYPRNGALGYGKTYYVTIDAGVFKTGDAPCGSLERAGGWAFTTKAAAPRLGTTHLVVAADGTGDFCTVQGAIDFVPEGNTTPTTIFVRKGLYTEIVFFTNKHALTIMGEDRHETVIAYATNDRFNTIRGNPFGSANPNPSAARPGPNGHIYHRGVFLAHRVNDLVVTNLTIRNTTPQGGSQAEAIILNGTTSAHALIKDVDLYSYQDTLQINGQAYLTGCYIEGDVDFMWGTGPCYFDHCTCRSLRSSAYYTQIRNPGTNHGYVYVQCRFDGVQGIMGNYLSRIGTGRFPHSEVVLLDCTLTTAVGPVAWQLIGGREGNESDPAQIHFWEFNSRDPAGNPVDPTFRLRGSRQLKEPADAALIAQYRNPQFVLGGWDPRTVSLSVPPAVAPPAAGAPEITVEPASQLALLGTGVSLTVVAKSGGAATYQWRKNGQTIAGGTAATWRIPRMAWNDAAVYTATVTNAIGSVTSAPARLTAVAPQAAPAPELPRIPATVFDATVNGAVGDGATDNTAALQRTIDAALETGGGIVMIPAAPKPYLSGPLKLGSGINLEIAAGATLRLLPYAVEPAPGSYPLRDEQYPSFLTAVGAHDLAITGAGTIDGDGAAWWAAFRANKRMPHRPFLVRLTRCERVLIAGITLTHSPMFHVAAGADHLTVFGITVNTPDETPNTDGVDPSGSHHLIQNCAIACGDDNVVMKPGGQYCSDITVADCAFGVGHGMSIGGQSNHGLDGMTVKNCSFDGTTSALRLKADPTQGGPVQNITYTNLTLRRVLYPIVFYSYYNKVGNPAAIKGGNLTSPAKVRSWNEAPPNSLASKTLPSWKNISITNLVAWETKGYSIIWGLPLEGHLVDGVMLRNVRISGGPGLEVYNATNVQVLGDSDVGPLVVGNALAVTRQPEGRTTVSGGTVRFETQAIVASSRGSVTPEYRWTRDGQPLDDGARPDGTLVSGSRTATLSLSHLQPATAGKYAVRISAALDGFDLVARVLKPGSIAVSTSSAPAVLVVTGH